MNLFDPYRPPLAFLEARGVRPVFRRYLEVSAPLVPGIGTDQEVPGELAATLAELWGHLTEREQDLALALTGVARAVRLVLQEVAERDRQEVIQQELLAPTQPPPGHDGPAG